MILRQAKNAQSGRACAPGGSAFPRGWRPPAYGRAVEFLVAATRTASMAVRVARGGQGGIFPV